MTASPVQPAKKEPEPVADRNKGGGGGLGPIPAAESGLTETVDSPWLVAIVRQSNDSAPTARRILDLGSVVNPRLRSLAPMRAETAEPGGGDARAAALRSYATRIRESYRDNRGGVRDGFKLLSDSLARGERIAVTCSCRGGEFCHADVVRMAIRKVHEASMAREAGRPLSAERVPVAESARSINPRTQRAINEILSVSNHDRLLARIEQTDGRNRSEQASHLGRKSQFVRDTYERGGRILDGNLIVPTETAKTTPPPAVTTLDFAVTRLTRITGDAEKARELAPTVVGYAQQIVGASSDGETKIKVFEWVYNALEGKSEFLPQREISKEPETMSAERTGDRFEEALKDIQFLAGEMSSLEPIDRIEIAPLSENHTPDAERDEELNLARIYEDAIEPAEAQEELEPDRTAALGGVTEFERIPLDTGVPRLPEHWDARDAERAFEELLPEIDRQLENGTPVREIMRPFDEAVRESALDDARGRLEEVVRTRKIGRIDNRLAEPTVSEDERLRLTMERLGWEKAPKTPPAEHYRNGFPRPEGRTITELVGTPSQGDELKAAIAAIDPRRPAVLDLDSPGQVHDAAREATSAFFRNRAAEIAELENRLVARKSPNSRAAASIKKEIGDLRDSLPSIAFRLKESGEIVAGNPSISLLEERRFAREYAAYQLRQPETSLRHDNPVYRNFARRLEAARDRAELIRTAASIRSENAALAKAQVDEKSGRISRPLTPKELVFLFTEPSPAHHTTDMTAARLSFAHNAAAKRTHAEALSRGEIRPGPEAAKLLESLSDRLNRRTPEAAAAATKHFLESLKTPDENLKLTNKFDHRSLYAAIPPSEREFIYKKATEQLQALENREGRSARPAQPANKQHFERTDPPAFSR